MLLEIKALTEAFSVLNFYQAQLLTGPAAGIVVGLWGFIPFWFTYAGQLGQLQSLQVHLVH